MDNTSIQTGAAPAKAVETAVQSGPPPVGTNGMAPPDKDPVVTERPKQPPAYRALLGLADLRITVVLFVLAMVLVFWGTLAQADYGNWTIVRRYFRNFFVWVPLKVVFFNLVDNKVDSIPFPGGFTIGFAMLLNLLAAHAVRFKFTWNRAGIFLIHAGIIVMMLGEFLTYMYATEARMIIPTGGSANQAVDIRHAELAVIRTKDIKTDDVVVVPANLLKPGAKIQDERLPFEIEVLDYMVNSEIFKVKAGAANHADRGLGLQQMADPRTEVNGLDDQKLDVPSAYIRLFHNGKSLGTWLFSVWYSDSYMNLVQEVTVPETNTIYKVLLRYQQTPRPYKIHLNKVITEYYPNTQLAKDYRSFIRLEDPEKKVDRTAEIYMNAPMFYRGESFYQSGVDRDPTGRAVTILQVVRNPGWLMPYLSCAVVGIGLLVHFGLTLYKFLDRRVVR